MRGFTVIELIVVLAVMALLSALALPRLTDRSALQERGARDQLRSLLAYGRKVAITQQREVCVLTSAADARLVYVNAGACAPTLPLADPAGGGPLRLDMPAGVTLTGVPVLRFNARGQPAPAADSLWRVGSLPVTVFRETGLAS